ncbi:hypothetical protein ACHWQZ_G007960 [Mnemiopsis leidyi]
MAANETTEVATAPKKVFVQRDYTHGTECKYETTYPTQLEGVIARETFTDTVNKINELFERAEELGCPTYTEGCLSCMTGYLLYFCIETKYSKEMKQISLFIQRQNDEIYHPRGVHIVEPMLRGLRCIELVVYPAPNKPI